MSGRRREAPELESIADGLHSLAIRVLRTVRTEDPASGIGAARLSALSVLVFRGPMPIGELAATEQVRPPTMTRLVQALEADGLVRRESDPGDRRQVRVRATARGQRLLEQGRRRRIEALARRLQVLPVEARADVTRAITALENVFGARRPLRPPPRSSGRTSGRSRGG